MSLSTATKRQRLLVWGGVAAAVVTLLFMSVAPMFALRKGHLPVGHGKRHEEVGGAAKRIPSRADDRLLSSGADVWRADHAEVEVRGEAVDETDNSSVSLLQGGNRASNDLQVPEYLLGPPLSFARDLGTRSSMAEILAGDAVCDLVMWKQGNCRMDEGETVQGCLQRLGARRLEKVTPARCRESPGFQKALRDEEARLGPLPQEDTSWHELHRTPQYRQQVIPAYFKGRPYVPPQHRPNHSYRVGPRVCNMSNSPKPGCKVHPIGFHLPRDQLVRRVQRRKLFDFLPFIPRVFPVSPVVPYTLGLNDEFLSNIIHEHSYFAFTHRRGGWDCLRHLEIMFSGCVPYFPDLVACGKFCMPHMPIALLKQVSLLPGLSHVGHLPTIDTEEYETEFLLLSRTMKTISTTEPKKVMNFKTVGTIDWSVFDEQQYFDLAEELRDYTEKYLTTQSLATYMLETIGYLEPKNILIVSGHLYRYLIQSIVHGFYDLGINFTVYPQEDATLQQQEYWNSDLNRSVPLSEEELEARRGTFAFWQGLLYGYGMRVTMTEKPPLDPEELRTKIEGGAFDLVIYVWTVHHKENNGWMSVEHKPFWHSVSQVLPPSRIAFVDTTDDVYKDPDDAIYDMCGKGTIFRRSLHDHPC